MKDETCGTCGHYAQFDSESHDENETKESPFKKESWKKTTTTEYYYGECRERPPRDNQGYVQVKTANPCCGRWAPREDAEAKEGEPVKRAKVPPGCEIQPCDVIVGDKVVVIPEESPEIEAGTYEIVKIYKNTIDEEYSFQVKLADGEDSGELDTEFYTFVSPRRRDDISVKPAS